MALWSVKPEEWEEARQQIARIAVPEHRQAFTMFINHIQAGWEIIASLQMEADRITDGGRCGSPVSRDIAGFMECEPTDNFRYVVDMCLEAIPGEDGRWTDAMCDVDGESLEAVRQVRMLYLAAAHPKFPPLLGTLIRDAYPRLAKWLKKLPSVLRPVDRLSEMEKRGQPIPMH